jgi:minor extracellular serine protease Vpr
MHQVFHYKQQFYLMEFWMKHVVLLFIIIFLSTNLLAQNSDSELLSKIDPRLVSLINNTRSDLNSSSLSKVGQVEVENGIVGVVVKTDNAVVLKSNGFNINSTFGDYATVRIHPGELLTLVKQKEVKCVLAGRLSYPANDVAGATVGAKALNSGYINGTQYKGHGVLVCIIDTGIDWKHLDFRDPDDPTKSRIVYIWDQTLTKTGSEKTPQDRDGVNFSGLNYGVEYSKTDINNEIDGTPVNFVREQDINGHGTHVAGTAAGNGATKADKRFAGIAPEADLLIVKAGDGSFSTNNIIDALSYAKNIAVQLNKPIVVNMSLGSNSGPHDGTDVQEQAVDNFVSTSGGRVVVISAGNSGSDDIHVTGSLESGASKDFNFTVSSYVPQSGSQNDDFGFDLWFDNSGSVSASVTTPNSITRNFTDGTDDGYIEIGSTNITSNGDRNVFLYVYDNEATKTPAEGEWKLSVTNNSSEVMVYHGWMYEESESMSVTLSGANSEYTVGSPGTANDAITVGSFVTRWRWASSNGSAYSYVGVDRSDGISSFSSIGPRRDGVQKPDITAPGQGVISVRSSDSFPDSVFLIGDGRYVLEQGTSMSSPITAGSIALLLQQKNDLTYSEVKSYIINNAYSDGFTGDVPNSIWGYGKLNNFNCMLDLIDPSLPKNFKTHIYDQWNTVQYTYTNVSPGQKFAVRFTPDFTGQVVGVLLHIFNSNGIASPLSFEIWSDIDSLPGSKLGNTVNYDPTGLTLYSWNYINLVGNNVDLTADADYYLVAYFTSGSETGILLDDGDVDSRTVRDYNDGAGWVVRTYDMRMRPIMAGDRTLVSVEQAEFLLTKFTLYNNYPNPFNPSTRIKYEVPKEILVTLTVYDILGREVRTLVNWVQKPGVYEIPFGSGQLASGIYFYTLRAGDFVKTKKMMLLK